jgi:hypothetical protein
MMTMQQKNDPTTKPRINEARLKLALGALVPGFRRMAEMPIEASGRNERVCFEAWRDEEAQMIYRLRIQKPTQAQWRRSEFRLFLNDYSCEAEEEGLISADAETATTLEWIIFDWAGTVRAGTVIGVFESRPFAPMENLRRHYVTAAGTFSSDVDLIFQCRVPAPEDCPLWDPESPECQ